jgi:hypothetical protein
MLDRDIDKILDEGADEPKRSTPAKQRDEVHEASDTSFPASDPPAYTTAAPRKRTRYTKAPKQS